METTESKNPKRRGLTITELKKELGLDKIRNVHQPIPIKKDGKHLYQVAGYFYPMKPETLERLKIPPQKILFEVDREKWVNEMREVWKSQDKSTNDYNW